MTDWTSRFGGKRFVLAFVMFVVTSALRAANTLADSSYAEIAMAIIAVYVAGNVTEKGIEIRTTGLPAGTPIQQPVPATDTATVAEAKEPQ